MKRILNDEVAYLLGALRDATADVRKGKNYEIKIAQKESSWLRFLQNIFKKNFGILGNITQHVNGTEILRINGKDTVNTILKISEMKIPQELWNTPSIIKRQPLELQLQYLRGFFDAEGGLPKSPLSARQKYLSFSQKNRESIEFLRSILIQKKFCPTNITFCGHVWEFRITRKKDLVRFCDEIGSWHNEKKERLKQLKNGIIFP